MNQFMADITLPVQFDQEFVSLIPRQRAHINDLMERGTVTGYSLSLDRSKVWVSLVARTEQEAIRIISAFPLFKYFQVKVYPLAFHNMATMSLTKVSLN
jgi:muconolactone delta-isomerase